MNRIFKTRLVATMLLLAMLLATFGPSLASPAAFPDVPADYWAYNDIENAVQNGIVGGYPDGTFRPGDSVTHGAFALMLARAFYKDELQATEAPNSIASGVAVVREHDVLTWTPMETEDASGTAIQRQHMAQMMWRVARDHGLVNSMPEGAMENASNTIPDWLSLSSFSMPAVAFCYHTGLLNGQADGNFGGSNYMNRAQACVVISRLQAYIAENNGVPGAGVTAVAPETPTKPVTPVEPEKPTTSTTDATLPNGLPITEENVAAYLTDVIQKEYPEGTPWGSEKHYSSPVFGNGRECAAFAFMVSDTLFGDLPKRIVEDYNDIRPGDVIAHRGSDGKIFHWSVATSTVDSDGYFGIAGGNTGSGLMNNVVSWVGWGDVTGAQEYNFTVYTRYPG